MEEDRTAGESVDQARAVRETRPDVGRWGDSRLESGVRTRGRRKRGLGESKGLS